jgi:hypothetical protein
MSAERNAQARAYVEAFARGGASHYIANLETTVALHRWGAHDLPLTINDGARGKTFVCSPRVGYVDYPLEELAHFPNRALVPVLRAMIAGVAKVVAPADLDRVVHINNWMMSTNLPVALDGAHAVVQTDELTAGYPTHLLAIRSLTRRHSGALIDALVAAGWVLLPSRQVFLVDDVARESFPRRDTRRDERLWQLGTVRCETPEMLTGDDANRIVALYDRLYLQKYSLLNPHYTPAFVLLTHRIGMIRYLLLRDNHGTIQGFGGMHAAGGHATMPLIGYDTAVAQEQGLYRLTFHAGSRHAAHHSLKFNMSSGAGAFKLNRGAKAEMEFNAYFVRHLPRIRQNSFRVLQAIATKVGMPILRKYAL